MEEIDRTLARQLRGTDACTSSQRGGAADQRVVDR